MLHACFRIILGSKILITGSIAYDLLLASDGSFVDALKANALEELSVSFVTPHFKRHHGGTAANIAWNVHLLGATPLLVSTIGDDGAPYMALLREQGIAVDHVEVICGHATATAIIATDSGERQISFFHPGADGLGTWPDLADEREEIAWAIVSARDVKMMIAAIDWCARQKIPLLFDPGQQVHSFGDDELKRAVAHASAVVVNEYESQLLRQRLKASEQELAQRISLFIVTLGEKGFILYDGGKKSVFPACTPDRVVNPTGAGDAFRGGLLTGLTSGWSKEHAAMLGASLGSFVVEQEGTLLHALDREETERRVKEAYGEELPM